jgi:hypothetical protein
LTFGRAGVTAMAKTEKLARGYRIVAVCFFVAGVLSCPAALVGGNVGVNVPIGMMNICIGIMFLAMSRREPPRQDTMQDANQTGPGDVGGA